MLSIKDLHVSIEDNEILKGVSLDFKPGQVTALMGPNGSGKSSLSYAIAGHPKYQVTSGKITLDGKDLLEMSPDQRAQSGIFLSFQYPKSIPGVTLANFLRAAYKAVKQEDIRVFEFQKRLKKKMEELDIAPEFMNRFVNEGFSGGEKKKAEILQAMILEPKVIIMDETDSGLDVDALKVVAKGVQALAGPDTSIILITHYFKILEYLTPDVVHVLKSGKNVETGGADLAKKIESNGFDGFGAERAPQSEKSERNANPFMVLD